MALGVSVCGCLSVASAFVCVIPVGLIAKFVDVTNFVAATEALATAAASTAAMNKSLVMHLND